MLLEKKKPHLLTCLFVRFFATMFLLAGFGFFVVGMVQFALEQGYFETLLQGVLLALSGLLLMRLRGRGIWIFALLVLFAYVSTFLGEERYFWQKFFFSSGLLLILCLLAPSYFALRRGEGRLVPRRTRFLIVGFYIVLTFMGFAAYYETAFCADEPVPEFVVAEFDVMGQPLHVSLISPIAQFLSSLSCSLDGDLSFERGSLS